VCPTLLSVSELSVSEPAAAKKGDPSMANSIVSAISRYLTPELVGKLASATGLDRSMAQTAVGAAVPSILSGLANLAARPGGAQQLASAVAAQSTNISLANILTGSAQMADRGASPLSSLLGGGAVGVLASTVSKFLGIGEGPMRTLMGLLAPSILGVLGREQSAAGLDANGLARMLTGQKEEIAAAMPSGLSQLLQASGLNERIASSLSPEKRAYDSPRAADAPPSTSSMQRMVGTTRTSMRSVSWPYWVLPLLALAGVLWYLFAGGRETVGPVATSKSTSEPTRDVPTKSAYLARAPDSWLSIGSASNDYVNKVIYNRTGDQLGTIKDVLVAPDGKMAAAIVDVGRYLGIGDKEIAVSFSALQQQQRDSGQRIVIDATKDALQAAPTFVRHQSSKQ
jgi:hypothetical protein